MPGGGAPSRKWFAWALVAVAVAGLAVRVTFVLIERRDIDFGGDARFYHRARTSSPTEKGSSRRTSSMTTGATCTRPSTRRSIIVFLAMPSRSDVEHAHAPAVVVLFGTATIVLVGLLGRAVVGARVGILAAALVAAVYPRSWMSDGSL